MSSRVICILAGVSKKSWLDDSGLPHLVMRYEDMVADPVTTFYRAICFLNLPYSKKQVEQALELCSFDRLQTQEQQLGFQENNNPDARFFRKGVVGDGRRQLTEKQSQILVSAHREMMARFGYLPA